MWGQEDMSSNLQTKFEMGKEKRREKCKGIALKYSPVSQLKDAINRNQKGTWMDIAL